jgi:hypothetical protein
MIAVFVCNQTRLGYADIDDVPTVGTVFKEPGFPVYYRIKSVDATDDGNGENPVRIELVEIDLIIRTLRSTLHH